VSVVFVVLPVALLLGAAFVGAFVWATRRGQFDDLTTPAMRALHDDGERVPAPPPPPPPGDQGPGARGQGSPQGEPRSPP
jgi:cbb3-type cytochrome oxidase maturation protein